MPDDCLKRLKLEVAFHYIYIYIMEIVDIFHVPVNACSSSKAFYWVQKKKKKLKDKTCYCL